MGSAQSAKRRRLFPLLPSSGQYHRLSDSSDLLSQPLLPEENLSTEIEHQVQAYWEKTSAVEKEIRGLKSNLSRLETSISKLQSRPTSEAKAIEGEKQEAITSLKEKVDKLKKSLDVEIIGREADKRVYSAASIKQGLAIKRLEEKNIDVEKEIAELVIRVNEMTSTIVKMAAVIAELKHQSLGPKEESESAEVSITDLGMMTVQKEGLYFILIFLIGVLIGLNL